MTDRWTHKPTGTVINRTTIDVLIRTWHTSPRPAARTAAWRQLHTIGVQLDEIVQDLERRLERGHEVLNERYDISREDRWLGWERQYCLACDALSLIRYRVVERRPELITQRREWEVEDAA